MNFTKTEIEGVFVVEPVVFGDERGWFVETYKKSEFEKEGINIDFVQDNHSMSAERGTLRGLHFQNELMAQAKLVRCTHGSVLDVVVDLRRSSPTYKKWLSLELNPENKKMLLLPRGCAHGFVTLADNTEFEYKVDNNYSKENDRSIRFDDPDLGIDWQISDPILSEKDKNAPLLKDSDVNF